MKKLLLIVTGLCILALPSQAAMNFYRAPNGQIIIEADDCQSASHLISLITPDDPPGGASQQEEDDNTPDNTTPDTAQGDQPAIPVQEGAQTIINALVGDDPDPQEKRSYQRSPDDTKKLMTIDNFNEYQEALLTFVRDVNWKTGLHLTWRDLSFFHRLRMVCSGVNKMTKPVRINLESYTGSLDNTIETASDKIVDQLAQAARNQSFSAMSKLSIVGLVDAVDQVNPFILLAIDEETYNKMVEREPKVQTLFENMYTFFKIRSVLLGTEYNSSIKDLIEVSKLGKGDYFKTWEVLSKYAKNILALDRAGKVTSKDEKETHVWRLSSSMNYIKEHVRIEKRAAELAAKDPNNASLIKAVKQGPKKKPSLDDKARKLLEKSTQEEIKQLIQKYIIKE